jgi:PAS domain S-box-containing protein
VPPIPEESTRELYENAPCGYVTTTPDGTIVRANHTFVVWTGYPRDELTSSRRFQDLLTVPGRIFYETHFAPLLRMQGMVKEIAFDLMVRDGTLLPVLANSVLLPVEEGRPSSIRTTLVDVTDRRRYEQELLLGRRRAEQLAAVVNASGDGIMRLTPDGTIQTWNGGAERLFGWTAAEAIGRSARALLVPSDRLEEADRALGELRAGREVRLETVLLNRAGRRIDVSIAATPHEEALGEVVAVSSIVRDVSDRRRAEEARRRAERLQVVSTLAGGVAHEVNNQMTAVLGLGEFVLRGLGAGHAQATDVQGMMTAAERAAGISQQLLAFSRQQLLDPRLLDLHELVTRLAPELASLLGGDRRLVIQPTAARGRVQADPERMEQVLTNLITNARDAMSAGGRVTVSVADAVLGEAEIRAHPVDEVVPGTYVLLSVADDGSGMEPATLGRMFEPFFTTKQVGEGTGLGLSMVYGIVKQHGGQIWTTSAPDRGTVVRIYLRTVDAD